MHDVHVLFKRGQATAAAEVHDSSDGGARSTNSYDVPVIFFGEH